MFGRPQRELSALMLMDMFSISRPQRELSALLLMHVQPQHVQHAENAKLQGYTTFNTQKTRKTQGFVHGREQNARADTRLPPTTTTTTTTRSQPRNCPCVLLPTLYEALCFTRFLRVESVAALQFGAFCVRPCTKPCFAACCACGTRCIHRVCV